MIEKITLDMLTQDSVSIKKQQYIEQNGQKYEVGQPWRKAYVNSTQGRKQIQSEVPDPYKSVVMLMWGDTPTVVDMTD
jgi:hypothetical protein